MARMMVFLFLILIWTSYGSSPTQALNYGGEETKLITLRDSIPKAETLLPTWFQQESSPCKWSGITCSSRVVTEIDLSFIRLNMTIPSCIGSFQHLKRLNLSSCSMFGSVSETLLGEVIDLEYLDLSSNSFTGSIFPEIGSLLNLINLDLSDNNFSGSLTSEIGKLSSLRSLRLGYNGFTGNLPVEINNMKKLEDFSINNCQLTGPIREEVFLGLKRMTNIDISKNTFGGGIPPSIGDLENLKSLRAKNCGLNGRIPEELGNCKKLNVLDFSYNFLSGTLPMTLAGLTAIQMFNVESNFLESSIPTWISNWKSVIIINLRRNTFKGNLPSLDMPLLTIFIADVNQLSGHIPSNICSINSLSVLSLSHNNLTGSIDEIFKDCSKLTVLTLSGNSLSGKLPSYLGDLPLLELDLSHNQLSGIVPDQLCDSSNMQTLALANNKFGGQIPTRIGEISNLKELHLSDNFFKGTIPQSIGELRNLTRLSLHGNKLSGRIPPEVFNCTNLVALDLGSNSLTGQIPKSISQLKFLHNLILSSNQLSGYIPSEICVGFQQPTISDFEFTQHFGVLDLSNNNLTGSIPAVIENCIVMRELRLQRNKLNGTIPPELFHLVNLTYLDMSWNSLTGHIPPQILPSTYLQGLFLSNNLLEGPIPFDLGSRFPNLVKLNFSSNQLIDIFPKAIFDMNTLTDVDISHNLLSGSIPFPRDTTRGTRSLLSLKANDNKFSGSITEWLWNDLASLSVLDLHGNDLTGSLPSTIAHLEGLSYLDLSYNGLDGDIPCEICTMIDLSFLELSHNKFNNYRPKNCLSTNVTNHCRPGFILSPPLRSLSHRSSWVIALVVVASLIACTFTAWFFGLLRCRRWRSNILTMQYGNRGVSEIELVSRQRLLPPVGMMVNWFTPDLQRLTLDVILKVTQSLNEAQILGHGCVGTVYKAMLGARMVAIKRLRENEEYAGITEFLAEMETLGKVKHQNLVELLGYCVSGGGNDHFLVYDFMQNGSLDTWLWKKRDVANVEALGWPTRFSICLGSARGLEFLHHHSAPRIIHRDIKSSNILLDENFEPRISDFGLARVISDDASHVTTIHIIGGTIGYIPPEYSQTMKATAKGDVYSFGVVILELLTGRPPTGEEVAEGGGSLVYWVRWMSGQGKEDEVFDDCLPTCGLQREQMLQVLDIAMACTTDEPRRRPTMIEVVHKLKQMDGNPSTSSG